MIRVGLKISKIDISDEDIDALIVALDDDGGGTLSIDEPADFVERGSATFHAGPEVPTLASSRLLSTNRNHNRAVPFALPARN